MTDLTLASTWTNKGPTSSWTNKGSTSTWTNNESTSSWITNKGSTSMWTNSGSTALWTNNGSTTLWTNNWSTSSWTNNGSTSSWANNGTTLLWTNNESESSWTNNGPTSLWTNDVSASLWTNNGSNVQSDFVLYVGISGYKITWTYFLTHIFLLLVAGTGIILNVIAFKIVQIRSPLHDISQIFISHLAMSDIFNGAVCIYVVLYNLVHYKNYYECAFRSGLVTCINLNSSIHLLSLTFDRYLKIIYPYKYFQLFTEKKIKIFSPCVWIFAGTLGLLPILGWRRPLQNGIAYCTYFGVLDTSYLTTTAAIFSLVLIVMIYCYVNIIFVACNQRNEAIGLPNNKNVVSNSTKAVYDHRNTKALWWTPTKTVVILITFYSFCWFPTGKFTNFIYFRLLL